MTYRRSIYADSYHLWLSHSGSDVPTGVFPGLLGLPLTQDKNTQRVLKLWREAVEKFHDPDNGISIVIGPSQNWGASVSRLDAATEWTL